MSKFGAGFGKDTMLLDARPCRTYTSCQNQVPFLHYPHLSLPTSKSREVSW